MPDSALHLNESAILRFPKNTELVYNKAYILESVGAADSSIRIYKRFMALEPTRYDVNGRIGDIYLRHRNYSAAYRFYNIWADQDKENVKPRVKAANVLMAQHNYAGAKNYLEKALEQFPENRELKSDLAVVDYRLDRLESAQRSIWPRSEKRQNEEEDPRQNRIFDKSLEISKLPKRTPSIIGKDSL